MPTKRGRDSKGTFYRWGHRKKYYYKTSHGAAAAKARADRQGRAIKRRQYGGDSKTGFLRGIKNYLQKEQTISKFLGRHGYSKLSSLASHLGYGRRRR